MAVIFFLIDRVPLLLLGSFDPVQLLGSFLFFLTEMNRNFIARDKIQQRLPATSGLAEEDTAKQNKTKNTEPRPRVTGQFQWEA